MDCRSFDSKSSLVKISATHFLQLYRGLTPRAEQAAESLLPGLKSFFLFPYVKTVMWSCDDDVFVEEVFETNALLVKALLETKANTKAKRVKNWRIV